MARAEKGKSIGKVYKKDRNARKTKEKMKKSKLCCQADEGRAKKKKRGTEKKKKIFELFRESANINKGIEMRGNWKRLQILTNLQRRWRQNNRYTDSWMSASTDIDIARSMGIQRHEDNKTVKEPFMNLTTEQRKGGREEGGKERDE